MTTQDTMLEVSLPDHLVSRVEERLPRTEFDTPSEYVAFVLEEVLVRVEDESDEEFTGVAEAEVKSRLESLGYLDE